MLVILLFFASGATALVYEVLWSKYLTVMLGSTAQAQTVVLAVFMGGLAIGNRLFGKRSATIKNPLLGYGIMEVGIGLYALGFEWIYSAADWTFIAAGSRIANVGFLLFGLKLVISVVLLLVPTVLMGGTLPMIAAWIQKHPAFESGGRVGIFYAVNSLGAMTGAGLAGFYLIQTYGMSATLVFTAAANIVIGLVAGFMGKIEQGDVKPVPPAPAVVVTDPSVAPPQSARWFAFLVALTGGVSMGLEVLAARSLALIAGGSLQAFALVLMSFIFGIGLGSLIISSSGAARRHGMNTIYLLLLVAGTIVVLNVVGIERLTILYSQARYGLSANPVGYYWYQISIAVFAFVILGLPAACLGSVVPLSIRFVQGNSMALGEQVGRLLTANTIGAVVGVLVTGFILMPLAGLRPAFAILAFLLIGVTAYLALKRGERAAATGAVILLGVAFVTVVSTGENWRHVMGSGVFRLRNTFLTDTYWVNRKAETMIHYYKDSADATVSVEQMRTPPGQAAGQVVLRINGKTDASSEGDLATQFMLAHLPLAAKPDAKNVFVLGFGSGITGGALLGHPIEKLTIAENCKPVLEAGVHFAKWNRGVLTNSRTEIRNDDARAVLKLSDQKYDIIINEPSNPWVVGVGSVFSKEYYDLCASKLTDGGIVAQWFHMYEMNDFIVMLVLRTFASTFPYMEVWDTQEGDIVMLGSNKAWASNPAQYQKIFERAQPREDLAKLNITTGLTLWARQLASQRTAFAIAGDGPVQTDDLPILEYAAPAAFFMGQEAGGLNAFDERTLQFPLAPREKVAVLRALPEHLFMNAFFYGSCNYDMRVYLSAVQNKASGGLNRIDPMAHVVFRDPSSYPEQPRVSTNATPEFVQCLRLESQILRDMANWREPAFKMLEVLKAMIEKGLRNPRDFKPSYYVAFIARCAIGAEDHEAALQFLQIGFAFPQDQEHLLYLTRVLDRAIPPEKLEEFRKRDRLPASMLE